MKLLFICCAALLPTGIITGQETPPPTLTVEQLEKARILGLLGIPLGEVCEMEGEIISGKAGGAKTEEGIHLLRIYSLAGKRLPNILQFGFSSITGTKIPAFTKLKFRGYETGAFTGLPKNWPDDIPRKAGTAFQFESRIVILAVP